MFADSNSFRQRTLTSRLMRGGWYRFLEDTRMRVTQRGGGGGTTRLVLANAYLDQHFVYSDCFEFSATETNAELWQAYRQLLIEDNATAVRILSLPSKIYDLLRNASDADLGRISQRFFCSFKLKDCCFPALNNAFSNASTSTKLLSAAHKKFLTLYWLNVWNVASTQPSRAATMFDIPFDVAQTISTFSTLRMLQVIDGMGDSTYELRFNPFLIEGILDYPDDSMIFSLMQIQQSVQKSQDVKLSLCWQEPDIEVDVDAVVRDATTFSSLTEVCKKHKISRPRAIQILREANKINQRIIQESDELNRHIKSYYCELAEMLTIWGLSPQDTRTITWLTPAQFRTIREKLLDQDLLPADYDVTKYVGTLRSKLRLSDKIVSSLFLSIYSRLGTSNIYKTVNIPAMIIAQIVTQSIVETPYFAPLQPNRFNPTDAWVWASELQSSKVHFIHCPKCGCLYISRFDDDKEDETVLPDDDHYDPNVDYQHPCPYCRYIDLYSSFGCPGQTQQASLKRRSNHDLFFEQLAKKIAPFDT